MKQKFCKMEDAIRKYVKDGDWVALPGFGKCTLGAELTDTLEKSFLETGHPRDLGVISGGGNVCLNHFAHDGMVKRVLVGHYGPAPDMCKLVSDNKCLSWNIPQGLIGHLLRAGACGEDYLITKVGLGTYVDPRLEGAKMNDVTDEEIVELVDVAGEEYLRYKVPKINVCILRGTYADEFGNVSFKDEMFLSYTRYAAMCCKAQGGKVIVECREYVKNGSIPAKEVDVPGVLVDAVCKISDPIKYYGTTMKVVHSDALLGNVRIPLDNDSFAIPLNERKVIGRRAAYELVPNAVVNIGIGMPEAVSAVVGEEGCSDDMTLSVEAGTIGGAAAPNEKFGTQVNPQAIWEEDIQFDYYHAGLLDVTFLGLAQINPAGDVNVSKFGPVVTGSGGFIDIITSTPVIVFCGTFTAGGLQVEVKDNKLVILQEGKKKKFKKDLLQVTFSGPRALANGQKVLFVTERAVFELTEAGLTLKEIAPGVDLEKDILGQMEFKPVIAEDLKIMDAKIFGEGKIGLKEMLDTKRD